MAFRVKNHEVINNDGHPTMFGHQEKIASVQIGTQIWMAENLRVKHYRNGDPIPTGYSNSDWADLDDPETGAYAVYDDNPINEKVYGLLYNWYAVNDSRGLAPEGWHIPSLDEWEVLDDYLTSLGYTGDLTNTSNTLAIPLKEAGYIYWTDSGDATEAGTNATGFTALPAGYRSLSDGTYNNIGTDTYYWTSTEKDADEAYSIQFQQDQKYIYRSDPEKDSGLSVRCIKDT